MIQALLFAALLGQAAPEAEPQTPPEIVRFANGELAQGFELGRGCINRERCGPYIRHIESGEIIMFRDRWIHGYQSTSRGQQMVKVVSRRPAEPPAQTPSEG